MIPNQEKNQLVESDLQMSQMLECADKKFKAVIITVFTDWKEKETKMVKYINTCVCVYI